MVRKNKTLVAIFIFCLINLGICFTPGKTLAGDTAKDVVMDTIAFGLLGGAMGLAYSYTIGEMPEDDLDKYDFLKQNVTDGAIYGVALGFMVGIIDFFDVSSRAKFQAGKETAGKNKNMEGIKAKRSPIRRYKDLTTGSLINLNGSKIHYNVPGIGLTRQSGKSGNKDLTVAVNILSISM